MTRDIDRNGQVICQLDHDLLDNASCYLDLARASVGSRGAVFDDYPVCKSPPFNLPIFEMLSRVDVEVLGLRKNADDTVQAGENLFNG